MSEIKDLIQHALDQDYNKASDVFGQVMSIKTQEVLDQARIRLAGQIYNGGEVEQENDEEGDEELEAMSDEELDAAFDEAGEELGDNDESEEDEVSEEEEDEASDDDEKQ